MTGLGNLIKRNCKLFFKDKGMFFTSLITPLILLVLYVTFLANVYRDSFASALPEGFNVPDELLNAVVGGELFSSLLAVCCVTVAFCSNMLMVQDKVAGARRDLTMTPVKSGTLALGYYISSFISTFLICIIAVGAGFIYLAKVGWYLSLADIGLLLLDIVFLVLFGTALSSIINIFLSTQGQISAVGTVVSAGYGFICGAYMPISNFSSGLQKLLAFLPGTYGTSLLRNHVMRGTFDEMKDIGFPEDVIELIKDSIDCNIYFFDNKVSLSGMFVILSASAVALICIYIGLSFLRSKKK